VSCLWNSHLDWLSNADYEALFSMGDRDETVALLKNPSISTDILCALYTKSKMFESVEEKTWLDFINRSSSNPRLNINNDSSDSPDMGHYRIHKALFSLLENAPTTSYALQTLYIVLTELEPDGLHWPDAIDHVLKRWDAVEVTGYKGEVQKGYETQLSFKDEFRCLIGSLYGRKLTKGKPPGSEVMGSPDDEDVAKRGAYYGSAEMKPAEIEKAYSKDHATFIFCALRNNNILLNPKARASLEDRIFGDFAQAYARRCKQIQKKAARI
jgi:hypothetical protein